MIIPDESDRVEEMARAAFLGATAGRESAFWRLQEFSYSMAEAARTELFTNGGDAGKAVAKAVEQYREERQGVIDYRWRKGLPVTDS